MKESEQKTNSLVLQKGIKIAAIYLGVAGVLGILLPFAEFGPHYPEFQAKSFAYKLGAYSRQNVLNILFMVSGIFILYRKVWARKLALVIIAISTIYSGTSFAWGFSKGPPSSTILLISYIVMGLWNGIWFYLIFKAKPTELIEKRR